MQQKNAKQADFRNSISCVQQITQSIMSKIATDIAFLDKASGKINQYSTDRVISVVNELGSQISAGPKQNQRIKTPVYAYNIKPDNLTNVSKIESRFPVRRGRSKTRMSRDFKPRKMSFTTRDDIFRVIRRPTYDKMSKYQQNLVEQNENDEEQQQNPTAELKAIKQKLSTSQIPQKSSPTEKMPDKKKFMNILKNSARVCYHEDQIYKVKNQPKGQWVNQDKNLLAYISKISQKKSQAKKNRSMDSIYVQTEKVSHQVEKQKSKKKIKKNQRKKTIVIPKEEELEVDIQFSGIKSLANSFQCAQGVCFMDGTAVYRRKFKSLALDTLPPNYRKYSHREFQILKSKSMHTVEDTSYSEEKSFQAKSERTKLPFTHRNEFKTQIPRANKKQEQKIIVHDKGIMDEILSSRQKDYSTIAYSPRLYQTQRKNRSQTEADVSKMSKHDQFNLQYVRNNKMSFNTKKLENLQLKSSENGNAIKALELYPKPNFVAEYRAPFLKNRQKLRNKGSIIAEIKKKFEENLRCKNAT